MRITSKEILHGPIAPILTRMTMPLVLSMFMMIMFNAVDSYFVSKLGTLELAAISFTFPVTYTIISMAIGLSIATSVMLAKAIGRGELDTARRITTDNILLAILLVLVISITGLSTTDVLFTSLGASAQTLPYIHQYMDVWYVFVGLMIVPMCGNAAIRATGDTKWPSVMMLVTGIINALLDPCLIFGLGPFPELGVRGAACAAALSWVAGFCMSFWVLHFREKLLLFAMPNFAQLWKYWGEIIKIAMPISVANMLNPISAAILTALVARYGEHAVAGFGAGSRIEAFLLVVSLAMTAALSPYMAQNLGARNFDRARQALRASIRFSFLLQLSLYPVVVLTAPWLARLFSSDPEVISVTKMYLYIMPLGICFYGVLIIINTAFNSAHKSHKTLIACLTRALFCYAPLAWIGGLLFGIPGLYCGAVLGNVIATSIAWRMLKPVYRDLETDPTFLHTAARDHEKEKRENGAIEAGQPDLT
ncbi:MAG: MATE family efflux transporter [Gammaproteobacteria bacterium]|nr:MATE family efflux transporter [Gammaproteobacteria bacterium]